MCLHFNKFKLFKLMRNSTCIFLIIFLIILCVIFFFLWVNAAVSLKYEVFNPTETYYYNTLRNINERHEYIKEVVKHNLSVIKWETTTKTAMAVTFFSAFGLFVFRKRIVKFNTYSIRR